MTKKQGKPAAKSRNRRVRSMNVPPADPWLKDPLVVRRFIEQRPHYEHLCNEVGYALTKLLASNGIKVAAVTTRAKTLESFLEKIERKVYGDPFAQITDFSGARVVCYYADDIPRIEEIIRGEFEVVEKQDKLQERAVDRFGYSTTHFLVRLGERASGARYDDLKGKLCEVQVRTVMQDAWAIFSHHLMYKHESEVPDSLKRSIHALAGALATADLAFQTIRDKRDAYIHSVAVSSSTDRLAGVSTNLDSVTELLATKFSPRPVDGIGLLGHWVPVLLEKGYASLKDVDELLSKTAHARAWYAERVPTISDDSVFELGRAILMTHEDVRVNSSLSPRHKRLIDEAAHMVGKGT